MSIRIFLIADNARTGWFSCGKKDKSTVLSFISQVILPGLDAPEPECYLPENFPWCFVIPPETPQKKNYYVGAFAFVPGLQANGPVVLFTRVSFKWMEQNLRTEYPISLWMARILGHAQQMDFTGENKRYLRMWIKALKRSTSPFWESFALTETFRFRNRSRMLLNDFSEGDYRIGESDGVDVMPWRNWPGCVQDTACAWIWRQSRHLKILESHIIPVQRTNAGQPDSSF